MFNFNITGLDRLATNLDELAQALQALDGKLTDLTFDPTDAISIENAITQARLAVDERLAGFAGNPLVEKLKEDIKDKFVSEIDQRARQARQAARDDD